MRLELASGQKEQNGQNTGACGPWLNIWLTPSTNETSYPCRLSWAASHDGQSWACLRHIVVKHHGFSLFWNFSTKFLAKKAAFLVLQRQKLRCAWTFRAARRDEDHPCNEIVEEVETLRPNSMVENSYYFNLVLVLRPRF